MKRSVVILNLLFFLAAAAFCILAQSRAERLREENLALKFRLQRLEPESACLVPAHKPKLPFSGTEVLSRGKNLEFRTLELNRSWQRPLYIPLWHSTAWNCERFSYLPRLVENNRRRVFIYQGGGSYWFDLSPAMGFTDDTSPMGIAFKSSGEVAIIALEARIKEVKKLESQVVIVVQPSHAGYHITALPAGECQGALFQVVTPEGWELEIPVTAYRKGSYQ